MRSLFNCLAAGVLLISASTAILAHHSFDAEFDRSKPVKLTGKVTKVEWMNPHVWITIDGKVVDQADTKITKWEFELNAPNALRRQGWSRDTVKEGDVVTVDGWHAKDGSNHINAREVMTAEGKSVLTASSGGDTK
ncbi:MAG: DUF6152 family protein [Acidobacteriota bacterium]